MDASLESQRPGDLRQHRLVPIAANAHLHLVLEVDAFYELEEAMHEMLPRLLPVAHDIEPGVLLLLQPEERRVALRLLELRTRRAPRRPELVRFREPGGFGQTARSAGLKHLQLLCREDWTATK